MSAALTHSTLIERESSAHKHTHGTKPNNDATMSNNNAHANSMVRSEDEHSHSHSHAHTPTQSNAHSHSHPNSHSHSHAPALAYSHSPASSNHVEQSDHHDEDDHDNSHSHSHSHATNRSHGHSHSQNHSHSHSSTPSTPLPQLRYPSSKLQSIAASYPSRMVSTRPNLIYFFLTVTASIIISSIGVVYRETSLISLSFHEAFMACAVYVSYYATTRSQSPNSSPSVLGYSYGHGRFELLAAFTNAVFLLFSAMLIIMELIHSLTMMPYWSSPTAETVELANGTSSLTLSSCITIAHFLLIPLHLFSMFLFAKYYHIVPAHVIAPSVQTLQTSSNTNIHAGSHAFNLHSLFILAMSCFCQHSLFVAGVAVTNIFGVSIALPVSYLASAIISIRLAIPIFTNAAAVLLQTNDESKRQAIERALRELSFYDGVLECRNSHFWTLTPAEAQVSSSIRGKSRNSNSSTSVYIVGSVHIRVRADADTQAILFQAHSLLRRYVSELTVQIEKDAPPV